MAAALAVSPCRKNSTSPGSTGTMMPSASMSSSTVIKMKTKAARELNRSITQRSPNHQITKSPDWQKGVLLGGDRRKQPLGFLGKQHPHAVDADNRAERNHHQSQNRQHDASDARPWPVLNE